MCQSLGGHLLRRLSCLGSTLLVVDAHADGPQAFLDRVSWLLGDLLGPSFVQLGGDMCELILLRREVSVALDAVEETKTGLVNIELLRVLELFELLGIVEVGLDLVRVELPRSCPHGTLDIASSVMRLFAVSCARHIAWRLSWLGAESKDG